MKPFIPILAVALGVGLHAAPVGAGSSRSVDVTKGHFVTLQGGLDLELDVSGTAMMFRTDRDGGSTEVVVRVRGLAPDTTYPAHVHDKPCSWTPAGGGHYQEAVGGPIDDDNEMWPFVTTDGRGRGVGHAEHAYRARAEAQSIIIHEPSNTTIRVACVDLR